MVSRITVSGAERSWLNHTVRCQAANTPLLSPHERAARVEMHLRPTSVAITDKPGQMSADTEVTLVCVSHGSRPPAQITWFRENRRYTRGKHNDLSNDTTSVSRLTIVPQPEDDGAVMRCRADNAILRTALEDSFKMSVVCKYMYDTSSVNRLTIVPQPEDDGAVMRCRADNAILRTALEDSFKMSVPEDDGAVMRCRADNAILRTALEDSFKMSVVCKYMYDTSSVNRLTIVPQPEDDGAVMRCRADNAILRTALEDSFKMSVVYKPVLAMSLGSTLNANDIKEGDDVYFECNIRANPKEHRISWFHNDQQINQNMSSGVIFSTKSLVLQGVTRRDGGLYTCSAANQIGEATSQAVYLRVQCKETIYLSYPKTDKLTDRNMFSGVTLSTKSLVLQGVTRRDGGLYTCSAANQIGEATSQAVYLRHQVAGAARRHEERRRVIHLQRRQPDRGGDQPGGVLEGAV
ncbi:neural cell adhesion molecule 2-like [Cydia splendana]